MDGVEINALNTLCGEGWVAFTSQPVRLVIEWIFSYGQHVLRVSSAKRKAQSFVNLLSDKFI